MQAPPEGHILIVEDDPDAREALVEFLIDGGYLPIAVADGVEALNHLRAGHRPALIVLDLILPRIDGWRFLAIVAENKDLAGIPVVVCSGADTAAQPPGVASDHVLRKPLDLGQLMAFVVRYCGPGFAGLLDPEATPTAGRAKPRRRTKSPTAAPRKRV